MYLNWYELSHPISLFEISWGLGSGWWTSRDSSCLGEHSVAGSPVLGMSCGLLALAWPVIASRIACLSPPH